MFTRFQIILLENHQIIEELLPFIVFECHHKSVVFSQFVISLESHHNTVEFVEPVDILFVESQIMACHNTDICF